jgi:hypothetical protein
MEIIRFFQIVEIIRTKKSVVNTSARPTCGHAQIRGNVSQKTSCVMVDRIVRMERMRNHAHIIYVQVWDARLGVIHRPLEACVSVHKDTNLMRDSNELALVTVLHFYMLGGGVKAKEV